MQDTASLGDAEQERLVLPCAVCWAAQAARGTQLPAAHLQSRQELKSEVTVLDSYLDAGIQTETLCSQLSNSLILGIILCC